MDYATMISQIEGQINAHFAASARGYAIWALSNAGSVADLKAVSQNLMHKSLFTTDEIYGMLTRVTPVSVSPA